MMNQAHVEIFIALLLLLHNAKIRRRI